jgi:exodeoxyribonuclease V beta subunit
MDAAGLAACLQTFCSGDIALQMPAAPDATPWQAPQALPPLSARSLRVRLR